MAVQITGGTLTNSVRTAYGNRYLEAAEMEPLYDQFAQEVGQDGVEQAAALNNAVQVPFLSDMTPGTAAISEVADINPQTLRDAIATVTPTSRGEGLQWSENLDLRVYTDYGAARFKAIGKNMMETVDILARDAALQGGLVQRFVARASLDAGTSTHLLGTLQFAQASSLMTTLKVPAFLGNGRKQYFALGHPDAWYDFRQSADVLNVAYYQDKEILFNGELGQYNDIKILAPAWAKVFGSAGAANASVVATTLSTAVNALALTIAVASSTNIQVGRLLTIGTAETGNTHQPLNERVRVSANYSTGLTIDIIGEGANGGLRFAHASGVAVSNADHVYPVLFGGPSSLAKLYAKGMGMGAYGEIVGPKLDGILNQFKTLGWKWYGNYGRWVESWLVRVEVACSLDA